MLVLLYLLAIIIVIALFALGGLIMWGLGSLVCIAFNIDFNFTYLCGLALEAIVWVLGPIFKK